MTTAQSLDHAAIAARIPHAGTMCLLDRLERWSADEIVCSAIGHADPQHPLRSASGLLAVCAVEYAAQAMALHGALVAPPDGGPTPGYIASVRALQLAADRLDDKTGPLSIAARREAGNDRQVLYRFTVHDGSGRLLAEGRAAVVLNAPLPDR